MNELCIIHELGSDADLLTYSDSYLETQRRLLAADISRLAGELDLVQRAIRLKRILQQRNMVATRRLERSPAGDVSDVAIYIMPLPDAMQELRNDDQDEIAKANQAAHLLGWADDGHDLAASASLRP